MKHYAMKTYLLLN